MDETRATNCPTSHLAGTSLSVIIPVFNSAKTLKNLIQIIDQTLVGVKRELILVNDGSRDRSWDVICDLSIEHSWVRGINLMRNYGQHNALLCGIRAARNEIIVTMDDDLQNPPDEVPRLLTKLSEGFDVVYGTPVKENHGLMRDLASRITKIALQNAMGAETAKNVSAFRAFRTKLRAAFDKYSGPYVSIDVLLTWSTQRFAAIPVSKSSSIRWRFRLYDKKADYARNEYANGVQHFASKDSQRCWVFIDHVWGRYFSPCNDPLLHLRRRCSRLLFLGLDHFNFFRSTVICSRNLRRIPSSRAYSHHG